VCRRDLVHVRGERPDGLALDRELDRLLAQRGEHLLLARAAASPPEAEVLRRARGVRPEEAPRHLVECIRLVGNDDAAADERARGREARATVLARREAEQAAERGGLE